MAIAKELQLDSIVRDAINLGEKPEIADGATYDYLQAISSLNQRLCRRIDSQKVELQELKQKIYEIEQTLKEKIAIQG